MLNQTWSDALKDEGLTYFAMADCEAGQDPFFMPRARRDHLIRRLRDTIFDAGVFGIAAGIPKTDWSELIGEERAGYIGRPGSICHTICIGGALRYCADKNYNGAISVVFDGGIEPLGLQSIEYAGDVLNDLEQRNDSYEFLPVKTTPALQAADMFAWELQNDMKNYLKLGVDRPIRPHFAPWIERNCEITFLERALLAQRLAEPDFQRLLDDSRWTETGHPIEPGEPR